MEEVGEGIFLKTCLLLEVDHQKKSKGGRWNSIKSRSSSVVWCVCACHNKHNERHRLLR